MKLTTGIDNYTLNRLIGEAESFHHGKIKNKRKFAQAVVDDIMSRYLGAEYIDIDSDWVSDLLVIKKEGNKK